MRHSSHPCSQYCSVPQQPQPSNFSIHDEISMPSIQGGGEACTEKGEGDKTAAASASAAPPDQSECRGAGSSGEGGREAASKSLPKSNLVYKAKDYWDSRFADEESYDVSKLKQTKYRAHMQQYACSTSTFLHDPEAYCTNTHTVLRAAAGRALQSEPFCRRLPLMRFSD